MAAGDAEGAAARARLAGAVRDRPGLHRRVGLLRARARHPGRARLRVAGLRGVGRVLRPRGALLRGGRLAAPGARRRDGHRPLRVQRAAELHRRLGDPARLHPADRDHRVRDHGLLRGALRPGGGRAVGVPVRRRGDRRRGVHEHPRRGLQALRPVRVRRARRPRAADADRGPRAGAAAQPGRADRPGEPRRHAVARGSALRVHADAGDVRRRRRFVGAGGRGRGRPQGAQAADDRAHARLHPLHRDLAGGGQRAAGRRPARRRRRRLRRGADARRGGRLRAGVAGRHAARADRHLRVRDPLHRLQRGDARALPARLLAGAEPSDPVGDRAPARDARDAGRDHRGRRAAGDPAADPGRHRAVGRDLRVRRHDLVHDRAPVGDPAALARARPRPAVQDPGQPARRQGRAAGVGGARGGAVVRRLRRGHRPARRRALGGRRVDGVRDRCSTSPTGSPRASRSSSA